MSDKISYSPQSKIKFKYFAGESQNIFESAVQMFFLFPGSQQEKRGKSEISLDLDSMKNIFQFLFCCLDPTTAASTSLHHEYVICPDPYYP